jgi:hypothetical protein
LHNLLSLFPCVWSFVLTKTFYGRFFLTKTSFYIGPFYDSSFPYCNC